MVHRLIRAGGMGLLAGIGGAAFAAVAAGLLHLSMTVAGITAGVTLAIIVGVLVDRHRTPTDSGLPTA